MSSPHPHDDPKDEAKDEEQIASILKAADADAAPPDQQVLAKLRAQSTDAFAAASHSSRADAPHITLSRWERWFGAVAAVLIVGVGLYFYFAPGASGATLGQALDNVGKADTFHVRVTRGDKTLEFWHTSKPNRSRWDELDGNYRITDGARHWIVNEKTNEARSTNSTGIENSPASHFLDLLGLPGVYDRPFEAELARIKQARPIEQHREGMRDILLYRVDVHLNRIVGAVNLQETVQLEARVFADTRRLMSIRLVRDFPNREVAELNVLAYDEPIAAEKFAIADTLTEDGRIGKVTDVQGIVAVKPVLHERWTPVREHLVLKPGDLVRTDARGANATALRLVKQTGIILGPKTLVELIGPKQVRLIEGQVEITPSAGAPVELLGPGPQKITVKNRQFYRVEKQQLAQVAKDPPWLLGFKGATTSESLGSLVALVDGRNVPLTVGYHKVQVDIRDQIARTVIEESFVNHTKNELEGVFYFPLPQDASISGFGMWIGDNLVEADVVEKQRAREIYEQIMRENKDPGLLEWSGGNIFKARIFPIPGGGEKRIKISYTQVLPLKGSRYRYSYALQSELLQQHPLRDLSIDVKVNSVTPLKSVTSPTHPTRDEKTANSAHVEFTAQEYTPTRDFEVVIETEGRQQDVVMIPHRRGDDGYFMLQLTPPGADGNWDRPLLPNGDPVNLLILADTSASIDAGQRATQAAFVASLLSSLTPKDTFNLATCDVTCDWAFIKATAADDKSVTAARDFLAKRPSLGWTALDATLASALKHIGLGFRDSTNQRIAILPTHVIYVGDGIVTTGDADPVAFTKRLRLLYKGHGATFHAVTLGSSYEPAVMKAIASLSAGSMRKITGEQGPAVIARELLGEIAQPALRDIKVEFKGLKAARVYPETLANVPAGSQQILLGRYLPEGKDQTGEVVVAGTQGGKPVRFSTRVTLKDAEQGNSFIPRLWARMHLDNLLEQGSSEAIKDEIIALSEEFNIITPYTSLLVLETDADRERFKVKRRFQMRDGERFFADGRDNALFDLAQKQMKKASNWRTALRRSVLSELARLGRDPSLFQPARHRGYDRRRLWNLAEFDAFGYDMKEPLSVAGGSMAVDGADLELGCAPLGDLGAPEDLLVEEFAYRDKDNQTDLAPEHAMKDDPVDGRFEPAEAKSEQSPEPFFRKFEYGMDRDGLGDYPDGLAMAERMRSQLWAGEGLGGFGYFPGRGSRGWQGPQYGHWLNTLFPPLQGPPVKTKEPKSTWPAAARDLANSLLRTEQLAKLAGGIEIVRQTESFDTRWGDVTSRSTRLELAAAKAWLTRSGGDGGQTLVSWCDAKEIGVYSKAFQLGRVRASTPLDVQPPPLQLIDHSLASLERSYVGNVPTLQPQGKDRTLLVLKYERTSHYETRILIDTGRHVILSIEERYKDKVTGTIRFDDFTEVAGTWWAQRIETADADGKRLSLTTQSVKALDLKDYDKQVKAELAGRASVQFLHLPGPSVANAKKALAAGKAGFEDHFVLLLHFYRSQQWTRVVDHLQQAEKLALDKPGLRWLRSAILYDSRRHEELRLRYQDDARRFAKTEPVDAYFLTDYIVGQSASVLQANEMLALLDSLKPIYDKQPKYVRADKRWLNQRASYLSQTGRTDEAMRLQKQIATDYPRDYSAQQQYAQALAGAGDYPAAYAWLTRVLVKESKWLDWEEDSLRTTYTSLLRQQGRYADLVKYLADWVERDPGSRSGYDQYLGALIKTDQIEKAEALALRWLKDAQIPGELPPAVGGRLNAAIQFMLGNGYEIGTNRVEERWLTPLAEAALYFARHETRSGTTDQIVSNYNFRRTEEAPRLRKKLGAILSAEVDKLTAEQVQHFVGLVQNEDLEPAAWTKITASLRERWAKEAKDVIKHELGQALISVLSRQDVPNEPLTFLRLQWKSGPETHRSQYANQLFDYLLAQPWSAEFETELFAMLDKLSTAEEPGPRLYHSVAALHRLTDRLIENRIAAQTRLLEHPEKLTRTELMKKQADIRSKAREGVADRLRKEAAKHPKALGQWLLAESLYLDVTLDRNLKQVAAEAWEQLGAAPAKKSDAEPTIERTLDEVLRQRYLVTLMNLAARKGADKALIDRLGKYIDQGIDADSNRWKQAKSSLLIALDRPKDLEETLRQWTRQDDSDNRWRIALGYLLAEQGKLADAIRELEAVEKADELSPKEYRSLADWYLTQGKRDDSERAANAVYKTMPEYQLSRLITAKLQPWQRRDGKLPTELDKEVLRQFNILFDKSNSPQSYLNQLQQFYQASHDFRFLSGLPDAVIGHSAARVYPFVQGMDYVLAEVRDEATADEIVKRIDEVRPRAKTAVDKRALDLLEVMVERRAAEVVNQPGPHRDKALTALIRASKHEWSPGEPRLMADFLARLGKITQQALADEQLRQMKDLHGAAAVGSLDRLHIAHQRALTLNGYQRRADAIDLLQTALDEFQTANDGVLPSEGINALSTFIGFLENAGHFARGEKVLFAQLARPFHKQQQLWLSERLDELYYHALQNSGEVSLGKGLTLYQAINAKIQKDFADADQRHRYQSFMRMCRVYRAASEKNLPGVGADLKKFAFEIAPPILKQQILDRDTAVSTIAQTLYDLNGPHEGITFLLDEIENEPRWLRYSNQDGWNRHGSTLASWRVKAKNLGKDEDRLLKLVLAELRRDLETREARSRTIYQYHNSHFWTEKSGDFAKTAEAVLAERNKSGASVQYIADYFYHGLGLHKRAIEVLFIAHNQKLLDEAGQAKLVDFLHEQNRYGESIPLLHPLVERRPENLNYRVQLMHAYFRTDRKVELLALLKATDAFFHEKDRWHESPMSALALSTLKNELFEQSVAYFKELIPLHERTQPGRGIGNGTLANYYGGLADAYVGLKKTPEAVEAASGAIVAWGSRHDKRTQALETLTRVLVQAPDLDAFLTHYDKQVQDQKQDSPIIRKAIGQAYQQKKQFAKAVKELELAVALQPNDVEIHRALIECLDEMGDKEGAVRQLLQAVQLSRRDIKLYQNLGERYVAAGQAQEAERAYTSIVEVLATETESHTLLAEIRQKQNRWPEAIAHWERVASLRSLEPTGLLKLAAAQIHEKQWDKARESLRQLESRTWPSRFENVREQTSKLRESIKGQGK